MPVSTQVPAKNIWVAAGDGDLDRVRELVERQAVSPNAPDPFTYTPMHAAASYGQLPMLEYLISKGGDVNITDNDGDTPLYTVENVDTARYLINRGAVVNRQNNQGISPIEYLAEEFGDVSMYLQTVLSGTSTTHTQDGGTHQQISQYQQNIVSEDLTDSLIESVRGVMQRAREEGRDPDEELRQVVGQTVLEGVLAGYEMSEGESHGQSGPADGPSSPKRTRQ